MGVSWLVGICFAAAVAAYVALAWWLAAIYATIPAKIPWGTLGNNRYFWYGSRAAVWLAPAAALLSLALIGVLLLEAPAAVRQQPWMALPFALMALAAPLIGLATKDKIDAARRHRPLDLT